MELWDQMGHDDMGFTKQNLRDQAARLEKSLGSVTSTITNGIKAKRGGDNAEGALNNGRQIAKNADQEEPNLHTTLTQNQQRDNGDLFSEPDLHTTLTQEQQLNNGDQERCSLSSAAKESIYAGYLLYGPSSCLIVTVYGQLICMRSRSCGT